MRPSRFVNLAVALALGVSLAGCASVSTPVASQTPTSGPGDGNARPAIQGNALEDPSGRALEIAVETARLAEERSMDTEALAAYKRVRKLDPSRPGVAHAMAVLYDRLAMTDAAQREYKNAIEETPEDNDVICDFGYFLYSIGELDQAERMLRRGLRIDPEHNQTAINLAVVLATGRNYDEATRLFENAIGPAAALHNIGIFKLRHGEWEQGRAMVETAIQTDPSLWQSCGAVATLLDRTPNGRLANSPKTERTVVTAERLTPEPAAVANRLLQVSAVSAVSVSPDADSPDAVSPDAVSPDADSPDAVSARATIAD